MSQSQANVELKSFSKGLVTEVNPLSGDISTASALENWVLHTDGSIEARNEYTFRQSAVSTRDVTDTFQPHLYIWENPSESTQPLLCVFMQLRADFYEYNKDTGIGALVYSYFGTDVRLPISVTEASGLLIATAQGAGASHGDTHVLTWDRLGPTSFTRDFKTILINDLFGIDDGLDNDEPLPNTFSEGLFYVSDSVSEHEQVSKYNYNMLNGGWTLDTLTSLVRTGVEGTKSLTMSSGLNAANQFDYTLAGDSAKLYGTGRSPFGKVKINVTKRGASRDSYMGTVPSSSQVYTVVERNALPVGSPISTVSYTNSHTIVDASQSGRFITQAHEGRVFYIGVGFGVTDGDALSPDLNTMLLYSQSIVDHTSIVKCHSHNDLTAAEANSVLATDGGFVSLPNIGLAHGMRSVGNKLLIFSSTGVWEISSDTIFKSTDYSVRRISTEEVIDMLSVVLVEGNIMYWAKSGIKMLVPDERTGRLAEQTVSGNIDSLYRTLVDVTIYAAGYDAVQGYAKWIYLVSGETEYKELHLNVKLGAFVTATIGSGNLDAATDIPLIYIPTKLQSTDGDSNMDIQTFNSAFNQFRTYITDGNKAHASMTTNISTFGDGSKRKQATFLNMYFRQTERSVGEFGLEDQSSCLTRVAWDFADHEDSNKYSTEFQAYRLKRVNMPTMNGPYIYGKGVVETRSKLRGSGNALSVSIRTEGSHCHLYGLNLHMLGNTKT